MELVQLVHFLAQLVKMLAIVMDVYQDIIYHLGFVICVLVIAAHAIRVHIVQLAWLAIY